MPELTVSMPAYNTGRYIGAAITPSSVPFALFDELLHPHSAAPQRFQNVRDVKRLAVLYRLRQRMSRPPGAALHFAPTRSGRGKRQGQMPVGIPSRWYVYSSPILGQHADAILCHIAYDETTIATYCTKRVV